MNKWKSLSLSTALVSSLVLASCTAEGDSYRTSSDENTEDTTNEDMSVTDKIIDSAISFAVDEFISIYFPGSNTDTVEDVKDLTNDLLNNSPNIKEILNPFLSIIEPLIAEADIEYYNVTFDRLHDADSYSLVIKDAYTTQQTDPEKLQFVELSKSELSVGEKIKVKSLLIDAPVKSEPYADAAKKFVEKVLKNATSIVVAFDKGERQDQEQYLMHVFVDGELLSEKLVANGLAEIVNAKPANPTYLAELQEAENKAKINKVGIWSIK